MIVQAQMSRIYSRLIQDEIARDGFIMVSFVILGGIFNYAYQLAMGIMLPIEEYGILFSLTSLLVILQVISQTIIMTISRFTSKFRADTNISGVYNLWHSSLRSSLILAVTGFAILAAFSPLVSHFLHLSNIWYPFILFTSFIFLCIISVNWGVLLGMQRFVPFGASQAATYLSRFIIGVIFVYFGWDIYGSLIALPLSLVVVLPFTFTALRCLSQGKNRTVVGIGMGKYTGMTLLVLFAITMSTNIDAILARHFLLPIEAGNYSALSVLGHIAFYAPLGVGFAMFPKASELSEVNKNSRPLFWKSVLLTLGIGSSILLMYLLFSSPITSLVFGDKYHLVQPHLFEYSVAMVLYAVAFLIMSYLLSLQRLSIAYLLSLAAVLQIGMIMFFHADIAQFTHIMSISSVIAVAVTVPAFRGKVT